jgi:selenocysteine-specific elongation factor
LRRPSPAETMGGGVVIDPHPKGRHKRFDQDVLDRFEALASGTPDDIFMQALLVLGVASFQDTANKASLVVETAKESLDTLIDEGQLLLLNEDELITASTLLSSKTYWGQMLSSAVREITDYHRSYPLRSGMPREELKSRLQIATRIFNALLAHLIAGNQLIEISLRRDLPGMSSIPVVQHPDHKVRYSPDQQKQVDVLMAKFKSQPYVPPTVKDCLDALGDDLYAALIDAGRLMPVSSEVVFRWEDYQTMVSE